MPANHSYETAGLDDPGQSWMQHLVRVKAHPEWGKARVLRYFPAAANEPARLRIMPEGPMQPQVVRADDVEILDPAPG